MVVQLKTTVLPSGTALVFDLSNESLVFSGLTEMQTKIPQFVRENV